MDLSKREDAIFQKLILSSDDFHKPGIRHFAELKDSDGLIAVIKYHGYFEKGPIFKEKCPYFYVSKKMREF